MICPLYQMEGVFLDFLAPSLLPCSSCSPCSLPAPPPPLAPPFFSTPCSLIFRLLYSLCFCSHQLFHIAIMICTLYQMEGVFLDFLAPSLFPLLLLLPPAPIPCSH